MRYIALSLVLMATLGGCNQPAQNTALGKCSEFCSLTGRTMDVTRSGVEGSCICTNDA